MTDHKWTDWVDHDGKGVPTELKVGMVIEVETLLSDGSRYSVTGVFTKSVGGMRMWSSSEVKTLRYRIRKPRALQAMIEEAEALPVVKQLEITQ